MPTIKDGMLDVTLLATNYPTSDVARLQPEIGAPLEFVLPTTGSKRLELVIGGYVLSLGYKPPVLLADPEDGTVVRPSHVTREWA